MDTGAAPREGHSNSQNPAVATVRLSISRVEALSTGLRPQVKQEDEDGPGL
jgi:hypothetical protein